MPNAGILILIGLVTGFLAGMLGAGGGFVSVLLLLAAGVDTKSAVGSSLVYVAAVAAWGSFIHVRQRSADARLALSLGIPSVATALLGAQIAESLSDRALTLAFAVLTACVAVLLLTRASERNMPPADAPPAVSGGQVGLSAPSGFAVTRRVAVGAVAGGLAIGLLQGLFGVGGGFLFMPYMVLILGVPEHLAVGSSLFAILLGSISGSIRHATLGNVRPSLLPYLIPGGMAGSFIGAKLSKTLTPAAIRRAFVVLMIAATIYLIGKSF